MNVDIYLYSLIARKACLPCWHKFRINRFELHLLSSLNGLLQHKKKVVISKDLLLKTVCSTGRERVKCCGYYEGLITKGFAGEYYYIRRPDTNSIGLTEKGVKVLELYSQEVARLVEKYKTQPHKVLLPDIDTMPDHRKRFAA